MYMKNYFLGVFIGVLLLLTYVTLPRVDYVEPNVFFYLEHLTPLYYLSLIASIVVAVFSKNRFIRVFSVVAFTLLIILTPSVMLVNPWHMDSYPFVSEAVYVERNGRLADFHYLSESPALGLVFGPYLLITGISPFDLMKIYPSLIVTILVLIMYSIAEKMKIGKKSLVIAPICLVAIMWPNAFHVCRQSFSLVYYLASWLFLSVLILQRKDRRISLMLGIQIILMVISHPATPLFFVANLIGVAIIGGILRKLRSGEIKIITYTLLFCTFFWLLWNSTIATKGDGIRVFSNIMTTLFNSLMTSPAEVSGASKIFIGYTSIYSSIINLRLFLTLVVSVSGILLPLIIYRYYESPRNKKISVMLTGWILSNMASAIPLMYSGLPYFARPALFTFISWAPLGGLVYVTIDMKGLKSPKIKKIIKSVFLVIFILTPSILIPVIKYAPLPFLYPRTRELSTITFMDLHYRGDYILRLEFTTPWGYSYLCGLNETNYGLLRNDYISNGSLNPRVTATSIAVTYRLVTRDAFWSYEPSMLQIVENVTGKLSETHNKVYDSGYPDWILIPRTNSTK